MSYSINGKIYTGHALMDEIVYNCKLIVSGIRLKNQTKADENETQESLIDADNLKNVVEGKYGFVFFPFDYTDFVQYGYSVNDAKYYTAGNLSKVPEKDRDGLMQIGKVNYLNRYVEKNNYFRMQNGLPYYTTDSAKKIEKAYRTFSYSVTSEQQIPLYSVNDYGYVYISPKNPKLLIDPDATVDLPLSDPVHTWNAYDLSVIQYYGILDDVLNEYGNLDKFKYLRYLSTKKLDYYEMRQAQNWDIMFIPACESLVEEEFKKYFNINRDVYLRKADQLALSYTSDYFDEMMMMVLVCQTFTDMIANVPEWYIRRDIFDLRSVKYFLDSNDIEFFKVIPLRYQTRIVKNMNRLIRYKSTTQSVEDILDIFSLEGTTVYKYFLVKDLAYNANNEFSSEEMKKIDSYDFGFEDTDTFDFDSANFLKLDFFAEERNIFYPKYRNLAVFDFGTIGSVGDPEKEKEDTSNLTSLELEDKNEALKTIKDEYGNVYELKFIRSPIDKNYDDYIRNPMNQFNYDAITYDDKYWDGEDVHNYVKNKHLALDTTVDGTKYMRLDYEVSMEKLIYQMSYFLGMVYNTNITNNVRVSIPSINPNTTFTLTEVFMLLHVLSYAYYNKKPYIRIPEDRRTDPKPPYSNYYLFDGGNISQPQPTIDDSDEDREEIDDFGCEERDKIKKPTRIDQIYNFGYNNTVKIDENTVYYDYGTYIMDELGVVNLLAKPSPEVIDYSDGITYIRKNSSNARNKRTIDSFRYKLKENDVIEEAPLYDVRIHLNEITLGDSEEEPVEEDKEQREVLDGGDVGDYMEEWPQDKFRRRANGGDKEYAIVTKDKSFYDWKKTKHPDLYVDTNLRILGYNFQIDLTTLAKNVNLMHSYYEFKDSIGAEVNATGNIITFPKLKDAKGHTASFMKPINGVINTYSEMYQIYSTNTVCYDILTERIGNAETHDLEVFYRYIFNSLFTTPFDFELYLDRSSQPYETYDQILKAKSFVLYTYYLELMKEQDIEERTDNIRLALNQIIDTLDYYIKGSNLEYIYAFTPIYDLSALTHYIQLMINFFKSWKVYFLEPTVTYNYGGRGPGKRDNKVIKSDQISQTKDKYLYQDLMGMRDAAPSYKEILNIKDTWRTRHKEVIDAYAYHVPSLELVDVFDGGSPSTTASHLETVDMMSFDSSLINGGKIGEVGPRYLIDSGYVAAGLDIYILNGGTPYDHQYKLTVNGRDVKDVPPDTRYHKTIHNKVSGGQVGRRMYQTDSAWNETKNQTIYSKAKLSHRKTNVIEVKPDGLYVEDNMVSSRQFNEFRDTLIKTQNEQFDYFNHTYNNLLACSDEDSLRRFVFQTTDHLLSTAVTVITDFENLTTDTNIRSYTDARIQIFDNWFQTVNPFKWVYYDVDDNTLNFGFDDTDDYIRSGPLVAPYDFYMENKSEDDMMPNNPEYLMTYDCGIEDAVDDTEDK